MPPLAPYKRELDYSYAPGFFPTIEALTNAPELVRGQLACSAEGYTVYECARCHVTEQRDKTGKVAHVDNNNDGVCDYGCGTEMHQGGGDEGGSGNGGNFFSNLWQRIVSFFQRIGNFFRNLFNR